MAAPSALQQQVDRLLQRGLAPQAQLLVEGHLEKHPSDHQARLLLIDTLIDQQRLQPAWDLSEELAGLWQTLREDPQQTDEVNFRDLEGQLAFRRAWILKRWNKRRQAQAELEKAVAADPSNEGFRLLLIEIQVAESDFSGALATVEGLLQQEPNDVAALCYRAIALEAEGRLDEADQASRRAYELAPENLQTLVVRGRVLLARGEHDEATRLFRQGLAAEPLNATVFDGLLEAHAQQHPLAVRALRGSRTLAWAGLWLLLVPISGLRSLVGVVLTGLFLLLACPIYLVLQAYSSETIGFAILQTVLWTYGLLESVCWSGSALGQLIARRNPELRRDLEAGLMANFHPLSYPLAGLALLLLIVQLGLNLASALTTAGVPTFEGLLATAGLFVGWSVLALLPMRREAPARVGWRFVSVLLGFATVVVVLDLLGLPQFDRDFEGRPILSAAAAYCFYIMLLPLGLLTAPTLMQPSRVFAEQQLSREKTSQPT